MDKEIKKNWIQALLSGKYTQGQYVLKSSEDRFCCLGVLADILGYLQGRSCVYNGSSSYCTLPKSLFKKLGIDLKKAETLIRLNDGGKNFTEIASWIEANT